MRTGYPVSDIRRLEEAAIAADPGRDLMQHAAAALASATADDLIERRGRVYGARVLLLIGGGNNGGDALYAGARLARRGVRVSALPVLGTPHPAGLAALRAAGGHVVDDGGGLDPADLDLMVDGVLGIGGRPGLPDHVAALIARLADVPVIAVDLPSGVNVDTGAVPGAAVQAAITVSFGAVKPCELIEPARSHCGRIINVDLGFDVDLAFGPDQRPTRLYAYQVDDLARGWPYPGVASDKYARGVVGIDAGSDSYPGAGILAAHGAVYAGAGMVRFHGAEESRRVLTAALPDIVFAEGRVQAMLYGSGWGDRVDGAGVIARGLESGVPAVVDADGLQRLPAGGLSPEWLITPHAGELARLLGCDRSEVEADPVSAAHRGADRTHATVLLKGATQIVARPGRRSVSIAVPGPAWTAQAGSGDVLAGICATLLAAGLPAPTAAVLGASLQAVTATEFPGPVPPHRLVERAAEVLGRLENRSTSTGERS